MAYYQFFNGGVGEVGPSKEELKLRCAQCCAERVGELGVLQKAFFDISNAEEFCTCNPQLEETQVFKLQAQYANWS